jgi:chromosome segregation ATPase
MLESISAQIDGLANGNYAAPDLEASATQVESENEETSSETAAPAEPTTVDGLKEQLTAKLREAEIELSINRAKLSQQRASIEQMQADLERREAGLEAKLAQVKKTKTSPSNADKKRGMMDRWKRHLGDGEG